MKQRINESQFIDAFERMGRGKQFSNNGLVALFEYLENLEEDFEQELELDVISLCCDYVEYENLAEFQKDYDKREFPDIKAIQSQTQVIEFDGGFIIKRF